MSNQLASLPWVVDTPSADPLFTGKVKIDHIEYVGYQAAGDSVEVQDENGRLVAFLRGNTDLETAMTNNEIGWVSGLLVPVTQSAEFGALANLQTGRIIVYIK